MARQIDAENGALADFRFGVDVAARLLDDSVDHRKPEPGALADILGGEERFENLLHHIGRNASACVRQLDEDILAHLHAAIIQLRNLVRLDIAGPDSDRATFGHGIPGIDRQIDQHLLELAEIGLDRPQIAAEFELQLDIGADQPVDKHAQVPNHIGHRQHSRPHRLLAREGQKLPHQHGGTVGVALDFDEIGKA